MEAHDNFSDAEEEMEYSNPEFNNRNNNGNGGSNDSPPSNSDFTYSYTCKLNSFTTKEEGISTYTIYNITTIRKMPGRSDEIFEITRRYSDFHKFQSLLAKSKKSCLIPALPPKTVMDKSAPRTLCERKLLLQKFLDDLVRHPVLVRHSLTNIFLTASNSVLDVECSRRKKRAESSTKAAAASTKKSSLRGLFSSFTKSVMSGLGQKRLPPTEDDQNITRLESFANSIVNGSNNVLAALNEMGDNYSIQSQLNNDLVGSLEQIVKFYRHHEGIQAAKAVEAVTVGYRHHGAESLEIPTFEDSWKLTHCFQSINLDASEALQMLNRRQVDSNAHKELKFEMFTLQDKIKHLERVDPKNQELDSLNRKSYELSHLVENSEHLLVAQTQACFDEMKLYTDRLFERTKDIMQLWILNRYRLAARQSHYWKNMALIFCGKEQTDRMKKEALLSNESDKAYNKPSTDDQESEKKN